MSYNHPGVAQNLGGLFSTQSAAAPSFETDFTGGTLDSDFTYARNDTVATYRDSSGILQKKTSANTARFDHDSSGNALGILIEGTIQNKFTGYNALPTDTTGWTTGGDAGGVFSCVDDPSNYLTSAKLQGACSNGKVMKLDNSAGAADFYAETTAQFGATTLHTISCWIAATVADATLTRSGGGTPPTLTVTSGEAFSRQQLSFSPNANTDLMRIVAAPGAIVYFTLTQIEALDYASSEIVTSGAAATRATDSLTVANVNTKSWFNETKGAIMARVRFKGFHASGSKYCFAFHNAATSNLIGLRLFNDQKMRPQVTATTSKFSSSVGYRPYIGEEYPVGIAWKSGESTAFCGGGQHLVGTYSGDPTGITTLNVGSRNSNSDPMFGHISQLQVYKTYQVYNTCIGENDIAIIGGGQSNMVGYWISAEDSTDGGSVQYRESWAEIAPNTVGVNLHANGATNASYLLKESLQPNDVWWIEEATGDLGECYDRWLKVARGCNDRIIAIHWDQGEADASPIYQENITRTQYKSALIQLFNQMRADIGAIPIFITPLGSHDALTGETYQDIREVQYELAAEYDWIHLTPPKYDLARTDDVHLTNASYETQATRSVRKILDVLGETVVGGVDGPTVANATRSGDTVTVTITHDSGTDIAPASGIEGFKYFSDGVEVVINTAVRTNATTVTLTLASTPAGAVQKLYYGYAELDEIVDEADMLHDNSAQALPLVFINGGRVVP